LCGVFSVQLDDGGQYSFEIELHGGTFETIINILVVGEFDRPISTRLGPT